MKKTLLIVLFCFVILGLVRACVELPEKLEKIECIKAQNTCKNYGGDCVKAQNCPLYE